MILNSYPEDLTYQIFLNNSARSSVLTWDGVSAVNVEASGLAVGSYLIAISVIEYDYMILDDVVRTLKGV